VIERSKSAKGLHEGCTVGEIAGELGKGAFDTMLDIATEDGLETIFRPDMGGHDRASWELRGEVWADDRTLIGASDAGAHLDLIDSFAFSTAVLQEGVREQAIIGLEAAIHQITARPAAYFGLIERGELREGYHADIVVFDAGKIARGPSYRRHDLPGGDAYRIYADAIGIDHVLVNGVEIVRGCEHTGKLPGTVLRSGRDTRTVAIDALQAEPA
jgi:N-acyl-D-aspartate/D-glutamate deacylase